MSRAITCPVVERSNDLEAPSRYTIGEHDGEVRGALERRNLLRDIRMGWNWVGRAHFTEEIDAQLERIH